MNGVMDLDNTLDELIDKIDKLQYDTCKPGEQDDGIPDAVIDNIADDVADFRMYKIQSYAGKSGRQIDDVPDGVMNDITDDIVGLIQYKLKSYVQVSGYSGTIPDDMINVILGKVPGAMLRKSISKVQTCISTLQADIDTLQADVNASIQNSDTLNEPAVDGILNLGQSMSDINITIAGQVISIGVDSLDSAYKKLKIYGAKMQHQNNLRYLIRRYGDAYIDIQSNSDEIVDYIQINGLRALKNCRIDGYQYGDTLDDFIARHGEPGYRDEYKGNPYYRYYYDDTYMRCMDISASDGHTIDKIEVIQ